MQGHHRGRIAWPDSGAYALQSPQTAGSPATLDDGSILYAELSKTVDAKKAKAGDPVSAVLLADVLSHGKVLARRDSKLVGHVLKHSPTAKKSLNRGWELFSR